MGASPGTSAASSPRPRSRTAHADDRKPGDSDTDEDVKMMPDEAGLFSFLIFQLVLLQITGNFPGDSVFAE